MRAAICPQPEPPMSSSNFLEVRAGGSVETVAGELHARSHSLDEWMRGVAARSVTPDNGEAAPEPRCQVDHVHVEHRVHAVLAFDFASEAVSNRLNQVKSVGAD